MRWLMLPVPSGKPWHGGTLYTEALGGSETAVAYLAKNLSGLGEDVHVMTHAQMAKPMNFEGVMYYNVNTDLGKLLGQEWDVVLSSRWIDILDQPWRTQRRYLWLHDMPISIDRVINAHKVVCLTQFQKAAWRFTDEACAVIGNGIDINIFSQVYSGDRDENKLIWTSNPDRGLPIAARIMQELRRRWPDLQLHVYGRSSVYGWDANTEAPYLPRIQDREGIVMHDPLTKAALAKELKTAWAWFYPTWWPETYCIAALEAQAAGTPIIAAPLAALNETVKGGVLTYDFLNAVSQLRNKRRWNKLSEAGMEWARMNTWKHRAQEWIDLAEAQPL